MRVADYCSNPPAAGSSAHGTTADAGIRLARLLGLQLVPVREPREGTDRP
jgi:hypothetical protein